jgi:hypothetical protein
MTPNSNPLRQFFRQPSIYITLPSGGEFWPKGSIEIPPTGELPVYPMTAIDEINYRTPDALFNGSAVVNVIQSCIPSIKDAWKIPHIDLDSVLIAIRIASYGTKMDLTSTCPACETANDYQLDLRSVMDQIERPDYNSSLDIGDLSIMFKPVPYDVQTKLNNAQYEQQRTLVQVQNAEMTDEEKIKIMNSALSEISKVTINIIANTVAAIRTPSALVAENEYILEFLQNCERNIFVSIRDQAISLREKSELRPLKIKCRECDNEYDQTFTLDQASFFEPAS